VASLKSAGAWRCDHITNRMIMLSNQHAWNVENGHEGAESRNEALSLIDPGLALEPSHISNDMIDVPSRHTFDLRHVAKLPMMRPDSAFCGPLKRDI
jgi:hypothetical protein